MAQAKGITLPIVYKSDPKGLQNASKQLGGFRKNIAKIGGALAGAFSIAAITNFTKDAVSAASDLEESLNAVRVSFGDAAGEISKLGETAATRLGLSQTQFNAIATQFSAFGEQIAGEGGDVVSVIDDISQRGADFASVFNLDVNDALVKFQSGLAGETEPLRKFGIDLSAARVEAHAYETGIAEAGQTLTEQQKVQARFSALMEQTNKVAGDFANTSDGLANSQRILKANFEDVQAEVGNALVPVFADLTTALLPVVEELAPVLAEVFEELAPIIADLAGEVPGLFEALVPLLPTLGDLLEVFLELVQLALPPLVDLLGFIIPLITDGLTIALEGLSSILPDATEGLNGFSDWFEVLPDLILDVIGNAAKWLLEIGEEIFEGLLDGLEEAWPDIEDFIKDLPDMFADAVVRATTWLFDEGANVMEGLLDGMKDAEKDVEKWLSDLPKNLEDYFSQPKEVLVQDGKDVMAGLLTGLDSGAAGPIFFVRGLGVRLAKAFSNPESTLRDAGIRIMRGWYDTLRFQYYELPHKWMQGMRERFNSAVGNAGSWLVDKGREAMTGLWSGIVTGWYSVRDWVRRMDDRIRSAFGNGFNILRNIGSDIMDGLFSGLRSAWFGVARWVSDRVDWIKRTFKRALDIRSPSGVFEGYGEAIMEGLLRGLESLDPQVTAKVAGIVDPDSLTVPSFALPTKGPSTVPAMATRPANVYNVTVNAGMGTNGAEVGRQVINAIQDYERRNGKVFAVA